MRIGILGGTFDPVHLGHLVMAEQCREQAGLDEVWFVPAATPPHKQDVDITPAADRFAMLELATAGHSALIVCDREIVRGGTSYTVDTLSALVDEDSSRDLFLIMGADSLRRLSNLARTRSDPGTRTDPRCQSRTDAAVTPESLLDVHSGATERIELVTMPGIDISATDIRNRIKQGKAFAT